MDLFHLFMTYIKPRRIRWAGHAAHMREKRHEYRVQVDKPEKNNHLEDWGTDGRMILKGS